MKITLFILGIIISLLIQYRVSKIYKIVGSLIILLIAIYLIADFSLTNWDNANYFYNYYTIGFTGTSTSEVGFVLLNKLAIYFNFDYFGFRVAYSAFFSILLFIAVSKLTDNLGFFYFFYFLYPIFKDAEQLRMFGATSLIIVGLTYICKKNPNYLIYTLFNILAITIHSSATYFLLIILSGIPINFRKNFQKIIFTTVVLSCGLLLINRDIFGGVFQNVLLTVNPEKSERYIDSSSNFGFLAPYGIFILNFVLTNYVRKSTVQSNSSETNKVVYSVKNLNSTYMDEILNEQISYVFYYLAIISLASLPLLMMNLHFYRIGKSIFVFSLIYYSYMYKNVKNKIVLVFLILLIIALYFIFDFYIFGTIEENFSTLFMTD